MQQSSPPTMQQSSPPTMQQSSPPTECASPPMKATLVVQESGGHHTYLKLYILAIFCPPAVFFMHRRPDRPRHEDLALNIMLWFIAIIPAIIHASLYLNDFRRISLGQAPRFFHSTIMTNGKTNGKGRRANTESGFRGSESHSIALAEVAPVPLAPPGSPPVSDTSSIRSIASSILSTSTTSVALKMAALSEDNRTHKQNCRRCQRCQRCYIDHVRFMEMGEEGNDHSRGSHVKEKHHVEACACSACVGKHREWVLSRSEHVRGCNCDVCKGRSKASGWGEVV